MNLLHEIAVRAKYDGSFTQEWTVIRRCIADAGGLKRLPGKSDIQKLKAWADSQGLLMDVDLEFQGFSSSIRTVTFWNGGQATVSSLAAESQSSEQLSGQETREPVGVDGGRQVGAVEEYFDWDAVDCR